MKPIRIYNEKEIELLRKGGRILAKIMKELIAQIKPGISPIYIEKEAEKLIRKYHAKPSFLGYQKFPSVICISVNDDLVHGVPQKNKIKEGDLVSVDLGIKYRGYCTDKAETVLVGKGDSKKKHFIKTIKKALEVGIKNAKAGNKLGQISAAIQEIIEGGGYKVVKALSGHGVGRYVHEEPRIFNFGRKDDGPVLKSGMVLAIEPMACMGTEEIKVKKDGFTIACKDGSLSCHFEDTVVVGKSGPEILTRL